MHVAPFAKNRAHWYPSELYQRGRHCGLKLLLWRSESNVWLNLNIMAYVLEIEGMWTGLALRHASYGQIRLSYPTLHDRRRISCRARTNWWRVLQCPAHLSLLLDLIQYCVALWLCVALMSLIKSMVTVILISFERVRLLLFWLLNWKQLN